MSMFCYQCEQASGGKGCAVMGVCGKDESVAALQDVLLEVTKGISMYAHRAARLGKRSDAVDRFVTEALFTTVTNVNFDATRLMQSIDEAVRQRESARREWQAAGGAASGAPGGPAVWRVENDRHGRVAQGASIGIVARTKAHGEDVTGLQELLMYGIKGTAAYADHALILGKKDPSVFAFFHEALNAIGEGVADVGTLLGLCLKCGEVNLRVMELLDAANTGAYGTPEPTAARIEPRAGKCILVSGHDLKDLYELLKQTEGKGIDVYTHGEMLPALAYPKLKAFPHLVGNYGGAWQDQAREFEAFPGAILMTTNCIQKPRETYKARIFTSGLVAWPGVTHISDGRFAPIIDAALKAPGFAANGSDKTITVGFGHGAILGVAGTVIDAVKAGKIRHFFLIGGCDGAKSGRNYYTDLAKQVPDDCVILTLACGKYRFNKLEFGAIGGIPRLLDCGQCNDAYSAIKVAGALAQAFGTDVNGLPLSLILSWYEQKACCILLSLLHLGIRNIRLGPSLPAFVTPAALNVLVEKFNIAPISTPEADLKAILG